MAECRHALPGEREQTHRLWQQVFGDEPQAQEVFYDLCAPQGPLVLVEAGQVACMLALTPVELTLPGCTASRGTYLYALATRPDCRGKGYAARLIACAAAWTQEQGMDFVCTVPAQPSLFTFFSKNSFTPAFYHLRVPLPAPQAGPVEPLTPQAYGALREELLGNIPHIVYSPGQIAFEGQLHGALYRLDLAHGPACAVVEDWGDHAVVKELLCLPGDGEEGARRISHLCRGRGELRTPCGRAEGLPFGAIRWLHEPPTPWQQLARGYLGLALD